MVLPPVLLKVEAASNGREGGQDREWAWSHRRLFGHTFARPVACRSQYWVHRADWSVHGHEVGPIGESDPMNAALRPTTNSRSNQTHHPCRSARFFGVRWARLSA